MKPARKKLLDRQSKIQFLIRHRYGREPLMRLGHLSTVRDSLILDLLAKQAYKRMTIKECLEHPWFAKINVTNLPELRRQSRDGSSFKMYTITESEK
jgi:hypothetical protein